MSDIKASDFEINFGRKKSKEYFKRVFIDGPSADSYIRYDVIINKEPNGKWNGTDGEIKLADCNRCIHWGFVGEEGIKKIDKVIAVLQEFREIYVAGIAHDKNYKEEQNDT